MDGWMSNVNIWNTLKRKWMDGWAMLIYGTLQKVDGWMDGHDKRLECINWHIPKKAYIVQVPSAQMLGHLYIHSLYLPRTSIKEILIVLTEEILESSSSKTEPCQLHCTDAIYLYAQSSIDHKHKHKSDIHSIDNRDIAVLFVKNLSAHLDVQLLISNEVCLIEFSSIW